MSTDFFPLGPIRMADLLDGRLEHRGVRTTCNEKCLTDGRNFLWVECNEEGLVTAFVNYGLNSSERILAAIAVEFDVYIDAFILSEIEPQEDWNSETRRVFEEMCESFASGYGLKDATAILKDLVARLSGGAEPV